MKENHSLTPSHLKSSSKCLKRSFIPTPSKRMKSAQVLVVLSVISYAVAVGYGSGGAGGYGGGGAASYGGGSSDQSGPPKPYNFDYNAADEQGNSHYRSEQGDEQGNVKGTYGYNDVQGIYRIVEYVADANGFRATIKTNEPGVDGKESPADVQLTAEKPPAGLAGAASSSSGGYRAPAASGFSGGSGKPKPASGKSGY